MSLPAGSLIIYNVAHLAASHITTGTSPERCVFLYYVYAKYSSYMKCCKKFRQRFPNAPMFIMKTIYNYVKSFRATFSIPETAKEHADNTC